jgi:hypothetical protein
MNLYRLARLVQDFKAMRSPEAAVNRLVNKAIGRALGRGGFWRALWGPRRGSR